MRRNYGSSITEVLVKECRSLAEFKDFILNTPYNPVWALAGNDQKHSITLGSYFSGTKSFEEALDLLTNGWSVEAERLNKEFGAMKLDKAYKERFSYDVVGFQASVPRYLQGIPTSMVNKKRVPIQNKIITITKNITYAGAISKEQIEKESLRVLYLVKTLEEQGKRVNLNVVFTSAEVQGVIIKVRIKNANERLSISKLAFPLVHPAMLRRLFFRAVEVMPGLTDRYFLHGYGNIPLGEKELRKRLAKDEIYLPIFMDSPDYYINMLNEKDQKDATPKKI